MCLIILANDIQSINYKDLEIAYNRNSNGFGVMYINKKDQFISDKFVPNNFTEVKNFFNLHKNETDRMAIHFRYTTEGKTNRKNCHPFISYQDDKRTIGLMHNGARLPIPLIHKNCSDTWHYNEHYLKPVLKQNPNVILNQDYQKELEQHINQDKFLFLDSKTKKFIIINENEGNYRGANWFSNDYWNIQKLSSPKISYAKYNDQFDLNYNYDLEEWNDHNQQYDYNFIPTNEEIANWSELEIECFVDQCIESDCTYPLVDIISDYKKYLKA